MTRGEAADFLEKCRWWFEPFTSEKEQWNEALDIAVEALTQDSRKVTQNLISRQELCRYALNQKDKSVTPNDIMRFPSAEPKTGEWVEVENGEYLCSNCLNITIGYPPKYCPYCRSFNE